MAVAVIIRATNLRKLIKAPDDGDERLETAINPTDMLLNDEDEGIDFDEQLKS